MTRPSSSESSIRKWLAVGIVGASLISIVLISAIAIATAGANRAETSRLVFSSVLPLLGTWVGTVLAFYFARENFEAATRSTLALAGIERATPVTQVMIPASDFSAYDLGTGDSPQDIPLAKVRDKVRTLSPPARRLPILKPSGAVVYVIHDSTLTAFAESVGQASTTLDKKLGDLVAVPSFREFVEAIGFVSEKASIEEARTKMASITNCNDVFVTVSGQGDERAIGWLTNTLLAGVQ